MLKRKQANYAKENADLSAIFRMASLDILIQVLILLFEFDKIFLNIKIYL